MFTVDLLSQIDIPAKCAIRDEVFSQLESRNKFAIWGTGRAGAYGVDQCMKRGLVPICVCDNFSHAVGETFQSIPLLSADMFFEKYPDCPVLVSCVPGYGVRRKLKQRSHEFISWDTGLLVNFDSIDPLEKLLSQNQEAVDTVYSLLNDEKSRKVYENVLLYRLTTDPKYVEEIYEPDIYFHNDIVPNISCGAFVDCGAYNGDTLSMMQNNDRFDIYYALEPDEENCRLISQYVKANALKNVVILPCGVWEEKTELHFDAKTGGAGSVSLDGSYMIKVDTIDHIVTEGRENCFIKMDIEGSEIPALKGAIHLIHTGRTELAISIYHHKQDLWEIPLLLHKLLPNHRLYIRHHTRSLADTVCYALEPK